MFTNTELRDVLGLPPKAREDQGADKAWFRDEVERRAALVYARKHHGSLAVLVESPAVFEKHLARALNVLLLNDASTLYAMRITPIPDRAKLLLEIPGFEFPREYIDQIPRTTTMRQAILAYVDSIRCCANCAKGRVEGRGVSCPNNRPQYIDLGDTSHSKNYSISDTQGLSYPLSGSHRTVSLETTTTWSWGVEHTKKDLLKTMTSILGFCGSFSWREDQAEETIRRALRSLEPSRGK